MQRLCILGSTGSIGCSTLDVVARNLDKYQVDVLTANTNDEKLFEQCLQFKPQLVVMTDYDASQRLAQKISEQQLPTCVKWGSESIVEAVRLPQLTTVVAAIVGGAGLLPTLAAVECGLKVLLANKEALVMSGDIFMQAVVEHNAVLLPVDSEHNAIFQCLGVNHPLARPELKGVNKILLTGSGGPFREVPIQTLHTMTPEQACAHPNWDMGKKISVDSATMMNKGLELIEACFLFNLQLTQIEIVVHPQSVVHSMVSFDDGSVIAQMGKPDMRTPIAHTLAWPDRVRSGVAPLDFCKMGQLTFEAPDFNRFPCLKLAENAMRTGGTAPCVLNAANEVAVAAFLAQEIKFTQIAKTIELTMQQIPVSTADTISQVLAADTNAREVALGIIERGMN
ncbi:1-deoxy-D-xylulose-5-phosphate reductoisomerase [Aliikangiella maris]|uniref:1-deoxy-D-xylulose 5-phosphate reductoisomerase n=2 Tax=Aliikangiella maris TaxID=3162458 RepID=A0ABV2BS11_9GAMM